MSKVQTNQTTNPQVEDLTEVEAELASDLQGHDETVRVARKTAELKTRLNANRCLVLSRYFKLLNAACPNEVEPIWAKLLNLGKDDLIPFGITLSKAEEELQLQEEISLRMFKTAKPTEVRVVQSTKLTADETDDDEEDEDHD